MMFAFGIVVGILLTILSLFLLALCGLAHDENDAE